MRLSKGLGSGVKNKSESRIVPIQDFDATTVRSLSAIPFSPNCPLCLKAAQVARVSMLVL